MIRGKQPVSYPPRWRDFIRAGDPGAIDALYRRYLDDPHSVPRDVAAAFARLLEEESGRNAAAADAWRLWGHLVATLDPLGLSPPVPAPTLPDHPLAAAYGSTIGWQFMHIAEADRRDWLAARAEQKHELPVAQRMWALETLTRAEAFELALQRRFPTLKRFGLEGAEGFLLLCEAAIAAATQQGVAKVVMGGMHRGRLNLLVHLMGKPVRELVSENKGFGPQCAPPEFSGDVPYHLGYVTRRTIGERTVALSMLPHPSHLSVVAAVALGNSRGEQERMGAGGPAAVLPLMMHTDAAFSGQGVVSEMLQLGRLPPFATGGAIHLVLDNHLGFTTPAAEGRSSVHSTDVATAAGIPVIHVNGDDPDAVLHVASAAIHYRTRFAADVVVNLHGYRRRGHNELDEPRFTQPRVYSAIENRQSVAQRYSEMLFQAGYDVGGANTIRETVKSEVAEAAAAADASPVRLPASFGGAWRGLHAGNAAEMVGFTETGLAEDRLTALCRALSVVPEGFRLHPKVAQFLEARRKTLERGKGVNWATAEALALASLADEGYAVRFGGQDTPRGAFAQRHLNLHDQLTGARHCVIGGEKTAPVEIFNTPLSEYAVLSFEYGMSLSRPDALVAWEAQFGDFLNLAQGVFDQCIAAGEQRWGLSSGLVLLLPHGLDGGGPDHSSARPERLLNAAAGPNIQIVNASTPAQYFHVLRRQMLRPFRKPLAVMTPKALLRHPLCVSDLSDFGPGSGFRCVVDDVGTGARKVALCSGKIALEIAAEREARGVTEPAIIRVEQLHPLDEAGIAAALSRHPAADIVWCEEEHENTGPFRALRSKLETIAGRPIRRIGRRSSAAVATGIHEWHDRERSALLDTVFADASDSDTAEQAKLERS